MAAVAVMMATGMAGCSDDATGTDTATEQGCELGIKALAAGLEDFARTKVIGEFLSGIAQPASVPCRNAIANLAQGQPVTFDLLRPDGTTVKFDVSPQVLQPKSGLPGGAGERAGRCSATFGTTFLYNACVAGDVDPL